SGGRARVGGIQAKMSAGDERARSAPRIGRAGRAVASDESVAGLLLRGREALPPVRVARASVGERRYFGVSFNSLLVSGVRGDIEAVPLSVNTYTAPSGPTRTSRIRVRSSVSSGSSATTLSFTIVSRSSIMPRRPPTK